MENTKISWAHHTCNLWWGCYEVHKGCDNCYAKTLANRYHGPDILWQQQGPRMMIKSAFSDIRKYQKKAAAAGEKYYIFMNSMSDLFEKSMPVVDFKHQPVMSGIKGTENYGQIDTHILRKQFFEIVDECPNLIFLLLTKRPSNIAKIIPQDWLQRPRLNVLFGTSVVDQETADTLIPQLVAVPGLHFLSMEPLVGPVDLCSSIRLAQFKMFGSFHSTWFGDKIQWVIVGGESGGMMARPMNSLWVRNIKAQCDTAGVAFFHKQWGNWMPLNSPSGPVGLSQYADGSGRINHYENKNGHRYRIINGQAFYYTGEHNEDALLDGKEHKAFPI